MTDTEIVKQGDPNNRKLYFCWFLVDWCNYDCSYCCTANAMTEVFKKDTKQSKHKLVTTRLSKIQDEMLVMLVGGEPSLHPNINEIIKDLSAIKNCKTEMHTNLSRSLQFYETLLNNHDNLFVQASYHPEYHSKEFIDKAIALKTKKFAVHINLSDNPEDWSKTKEMHSSLSNAGVKVMYQYLFSANRRTINYTEEFYKTFGDDYDSIATIRYPFEYADGTKQEFTSTEIYKQELDNFKGYKCRTQMFNIDINGNIQNYCTIEKLPLILTEENIYKYVTCPLESCTCDQMFDFPKEKL